MSHATLSPCRFVAHSLGAVFVIPLALRFPRRPLLLVAAQSIIMCMVKPYPSVADHALYMALLTLLQKQLSKLRTGLLLCNSFLLLAVLAPSMWHQWIDIESANSNFFYSITLVMGGWQTVLLVQLLLLTIGIERQEAGKA
jgi:GPI-anchor transamidase subunit U